MVAHVALVAVGRAGAAGFRVAAGAGRAGVAAARTGASAARAGASAARTTQAAGRAAGGAARTGRGAMQAGRGAAKAGSRTTGRAHRLQRGGGKHGRSRLENRARRQLQDRLRGGDDRSRSRRRGGSGLNRSSPNDAQGEDAQRTTDAEAHLRKGLRTAAATAVAVRHPLRALGRAASKGGRRLAGAKSRPGKRKRRGGRGGRVRRWVIIGLASVLIFGMISSTPLLMPSFGSGNDRANAGATLTNADTMEEAFVEAGVPEAYADDFVATANMGIDPRLVAAVAWQESIHFDEEVIACEHDSPKGAKGIMQFMPETAQERHVDPCRPGEAITAGARYLLEIYGDVQTWDLALAGYNAGPNGVSDCRCIPQNGETERYVPAVKTQWDEYKRSVPEPRFQGTQATGDNPGGPKGSTERYTESRITPIMQALLDQAVPLFGRGHGVGCFRNQGDGEHPKGRACDFIMSNPLNTRPTPDYLEHGWRFACWMIQNAEALNVRYVIWQKLIWQDNDRSTDPARRCNANRQGDGWSDYTRYPNGNLQQNHYDHIHVSVN